MKFSYWFYDEVYFQNYYFLCGYTNEEIKEYILQESGVEYQPTGKRVDGRCLEVISDDGRCRVFICISSGDTSASTVTALAHESLHATNYVLSRCGVGIDIDKNDEAQTYYMGYIFRKCLDALYSERDKLLTSTGG